MVLYPTIQQSVSRRIALFLPYVDRPQSISPPQSSPSAQHFYAAIIGAGFGGLGAAIRLRQAGVEDFTILERDADVGGTWRANIYPGCQCDVPSNLYSFSFAPNPDWSRAFAPQAEIEAYLHRLTARYQLRPRIRFGETVLAAHWDEAAALWRLTISTGEITARILIAGQGALSQPAVPDWPGLACFSGSAFHPAQWDPAQELAGRRVAVVGTGASAAQIIPAIQPQVKQLLVFQRTPPWIVPRMDGPVPLWKRRLYRRLPLMQQLSRLRHYLFNEMMVLWFIYFPSGRKWIEREARKHLERQVADPTLRAQLTPSFEIGCKRILLSDDYYLALQQANVKLITRSVRELESGAIVTDDGQRHEVDTIVLATGFAVTNHPITRHVFGRDGRSLAEHWSHGPQTHLGITAAGFPNLFLIAGPNTGIGHTSLLYMIEAQLEFIVGATRWMRDSGVVALEPKAIVCAEFAAEMERRLATSVWNAGRCRSWYLDSSGRNTTMWPGFTWEYALRASRFDATKYLARQEVGWASPTKSG